MLEINIHNAVVGSNEFKKVPLSWTISSLRNFFAKVYKIPVAMQKLEIKINEESPAEEITEDHKTISFYNVTETSTFIISMR